MKLSTLKRIRQIVAQHVKKNVSDRITMYNDVILTNRFIVFLSHDISVVVRHGVIFQEDIQELFIDADMLLSFLTVDGIPRITASDIAKEVAFEESVYSFAKTEQSDMAKELDNHTKTFHGEYQNYKIILSEDIRKICEAGKYVAKDLLRPAMSYVKYDDKYIVGSDAHRLLYLKKEPESASDSQINIPPMVVKILDLFKDKSFYLTSKTGYNKLMNDDVMISWKASNYSETYPAWQSVVPALQNMPGDRSSLIVSQTDIEKAVQFLSGHYYDGKEKMSIQFTKNDIRLGKENTSSTGWYRIPAFRHEGKPKFKGETIYMMYHFFCDAVRANKGNRAFKINFGEPTKCAVFNDNLLIMPCML